MASYARWARSKALLAKTSGLSVSDTDPGRCSACSRAGAALPATETEGAIAFPALFVPSAGPNAICSCLPRSMSSRNRSVSCLVLFNHSCSNSNLLSSHVCSGGRWSRAAVGAPDRVVVGALDRAAAGAPDRALAGAPGRAAAGAPERALAGAPDRALAGASDRAAAGAPGILATIALASFLSSPPNIASFSSCLSINSLTI